MRRVLIVLAPTAAAFGSLIPGVGPLFGFRLIALALLLVVVVSGSDELSKLSTSRRIVTLLVVWIAIGCALLPFVSDSRAALQELGSIGSGGAFVYAVLRSGHAQRNLNDLVRGWGLAFVCAGGIAIYEFLTGEHLSNYLAGNLYGGSSDGFSRIDSRLLASTFSNPNAYATFLVGVFPVLVVGYVCTGSSRARWFWVACIIALPMLLLGTGSRLGMVALAVQMVALLYFGGKQFRKLFLGTLASGLVAILAIGQGALRPILDRLPGKISESSQIAGFLPNFWDSNGAAGVRVNLYRDGIWMILDSAGIGVGPGNFEVAMLGPDIPYPTASVLSPHNAVLELVAQYGLILLIPAFACVVGWVSVSRRVARRDEPRIQVWGAAVLTALLGYLAMMFANSSFLDSSTNWAMFATITLSVCCMEQGLLRTSASDVSTGPDATTTRSRKGRFSDYGGGTQHERS